MEGMHTMPEAITPAVPPTPPVPLSALLAREDLALRQIAGPSDPDIVIHWAHTSEMADPYPYLLGGELLLTAGVHIPEAAGSGTYFDDYVSRIVAAGGAALGFGLAPVHDTVPRALVHACDAYDLPLLEVPPQTTFSGVARAVWQLMAQARLAELRRVTEAQQSLAAAASRPDPVPSVLRQLAGRLSGHAILYGPDGTEIAAAGREPAQGAREALAALAGVVRPPSAREPVQPREAAAGAAGTGASGPTGAAGSGTGRSAGHSTTGPASGSASTSADHRTSGGAQAARTGTSSPTDPAGGSTGRSAGHSTTSPASGSAARPIPTSATAARPIPTSATDTHGDTHLAAYALGAGEGFVLGVASSRREPGDHTIASVASVLLSLLTGEHHSGAGAARSSALVRLLLGAAPEEVAPLVGEGQWVVVHARPETQAPDAVAASALGAALGSPLVDLARDVVRVLVPAEREPVPQPGWSLGVSAAAGPREWPAADTQAARALARARATRSPLVRHGARPGLEDLVPRADAEAHARALLAPLAAQPALAETLRSWLSLHGSWDRTAVALDVHRNTVRQRITRCAALLEADLDDPDVRMELWFALRQA
ncbi:PucR family transcriptional regulator ligand-binding domain-containing protein [Streptomyces sp. NPDC001816]|uniref:PucR family transcriptional regulator ligand-binding domain-containing protein n=1 Tax=Streptomyces sp. NPDC001816 TaxID=3364612 RepID=UPI0036945DF1